ncbi:MAG: right-handed parallel beta-helix repeat-containing protein, partial [Pseudomonadales bacterium]|nr:right-handed parallel beta-helix repeat-containing protein [Pseudomonadales bacterium]
MFGGAKTLQQILPQLRVGDSVMFGAGEHVVGNLKLNGVSLLAQKAGTATLRGNITYTLEAMLEGLHIDGRINIEGVGAKLLLKNCRLEHAADNVLVTRDYVDVVLQDCEIFCSGANHPALFADSGSKIHLRGCRFHDIPANGVEALNNSQCWIEDCSFAHSSGLAVYLQNGAKAFISRSSFNNAETGMLTASEGSLLEVSDCQFARLGSHVGVYATTRSRVILRNSSFTQGRNGALMAGESSQMEVTDCTFAQFDANIVGADGKGSRITLRGCRLDGDFTRIVPASTDEQGVVLMENSMLNGVAAPNYDSRQKAQPAKTASGMAEHAAAPNAVSGTSDVRSELEKLTGLHGVKEE